MEPSPREPPPRASQGLYAVPARYHLTLHSEGRGCRLGSVSPHADSGARRFRLSPFGRVARHYWFQVPQKFLALRVLATEIRPTGLEALVEVRTEVLRPPACGAIDPDPALLREAVRWFKAVTTAAYARGMQTRGWAALSGLVWERSYERLLLRTPQALSAAIDRFAPRPP